MHCLTKAVTRKGTEAVSQGESCMDHDSEAALRRVAIVLSSLPETTVARLIKGLGGEQQRAVRAALSRLSDVDPLERRRVLDAFAVSLRQGNLSLSSDNDAAEIVLSRAARQHAQDYPSPRYSAPATASAPLAFLSQVDDDALAAEIRQEHPQTMAIILASLAPGQAARILQRLDVATRQEAMRRLGKLDAPPAEVVSDIGIQLKNKLLAAGTHLGVFADRPGSSAKGKAGQEALRAILAEMPVTGEQAGQAASAGAAPSLPLSASMYSSGRAPLTASGSGLGYQRRETPSKPAAEESAEVIHARLVALPTERLRQALAAVETRQSLLALCGLPSATAEKVLAALPRRQARQVRRQLADLGTIELREIDRAKAAVAAAADWFAHELQQAGASAASRPGSLMAA